MKRYINNKIEKASMCICFLNLRYTQYNEPRESSSSNSARSTSLLNMNPII